MKYILISTLKNREEFDDIINEIYNFTKFMIEDYIEYNKWYFNNNLSGIINGTREIIICVNNHEIVGCIFLKNEF